MVRNKWLSYGLVGVQFICIGFLLMTSQLTNIKLVELFLIVAGATLIFWATWMMRESTLRVIPDVAGNATLITNGPYHYIRHPMYAGVLLLCLGLFLLDMSTIRTITYGLLCLVLYIKYRYEERLLLEKFPEYAEYKLKTFRFIPFVY